MPRIRRFFLTSLALFFLLVRKTARQKSKNNNFLIVYPTNNIGDMVCVTPLFTAIKKSIPHSRITVLGSEINQKLLEGHPLVDAYVIFRSTWSSLLGIWKGAYDSSVVINMDSDHVALLILGGVDAVSCLAFNSSYTNKTPIFYKILSKYTYTTEYTPGKYVPTQYLNLLKPFGIIHDNPKKYLTSSQEASDSVSRTLNDIGLRDMQPWVVVAPGAGSTIKQWGPENFATICNYIHHIHGSIIFIGSPHDTDVISRVIEKLNQNVVYWNPGPLSMDMLKATLASATLVIGNDSGAIHVAQAVGTKTITVAGATDVAEHMQADNNNAIVAAAGDPKKLYRSYIDYEKKEYATYAQNQMHKVQAQDVIQAIDSILS